jgi:hypothetical protein
MSESPLIKITEGRGDDSIDAEKAHYKFLQVTE